MQPCRLMLMTLALVLVITGTGTMADSAEQLEESVCGAVREPLAFWLWSGAAGKPDPEPAERLPNAEPITYETKDGRLLQGYRLKSSTPESEAGNSVLVAQGNAMLADQLLGALGSFSRAGIEVYIFDYRGYGNSEGKRRLKAIVSDYRELFDHINASTEGKLALYGISFGGIVLLNVVGSGVDFARFVIDSTPSRVSPYGCPKAYDPVENFPEDGSRFMLIAGDRDTVVSRRDSQELLDLARSRGARIEIRSDYAHPFMDADINTHRSRLELIKSFLKGNAAQR